MACVWRKQQLGLAFYDTLTCTFSLVPDLAEDIGFPTLLRCMNNSVRFVCPGPPMPSEYMICLQSSTPALLIYVGSPV